MRPRPRRSYASERRTLEAEVSHRPDFRPLATERRFRPFAPPHGHATAPADAALGTGWDLEHKEDPLPHPESVTATTWNDALFKHRDRLLVAWCLITCLPLLPPKGWLPSLAPLLAGLALRLWARTYIGPHSRGRSLAAPYRVVGGPYRWLAHPLYVANLLVLAGLFLHTTGPVWRVLIPFAGPVVLYILLGRHESRHLARTDPETTDAPLAPGSRRLLSEWASTLPPLALWLALSGWIHR